MKRNLYRATSNYVNRTVYIRAPSLMAANMRAHSFFHGLVGKRGEDEKLYVPDSVELVADAENLIDSQEIEA